jgi:hypothetical protein
MACLVHEVQVDGIGSTDDSQSVDLIEVVMT